MRYKKYKLANKNINEAKIRDGRQTDRQNLRKHLSVHKNSLKKQHEKIERIPSTLSINLNKHKKLRYTQKKCEHFHLKKKVSLPHSSYT